MENSEYIADFPFLDMLLKCDYKQYRAIKEVSNHTLVFYNCDNFILFKNHYYPSLIINIMTYECIIIIIFVLNIAPSQQGMCLYMYALY